MNKKKGYNWKARQVADVVIENQEKILVENTDSHLGKFDQSNPLVLPSKKRKTKKKKQNVIAEKILSKKQRKLYEKILEKKKKKERRAILTKELRSIQGPIDVLNKLTPITEVQTKGRKRAFNAERSEFSDKSFPDDESYSLRVTKSKFKKLSSISESHENNPNVVGFETSDSESDDDVETVNQSEPNTSSCPDVDVHQISNEQANEVTIDVDETVSQLATCDEVMKEEKSNVSQEKTILENEPEKKSHVTSCENVKISTSTIAKENKVFIAVDRDPKIQQARLKLPIIGEEQTIMEAINENDVVIIAGETGSGKTTQLPQFLYEAGYTSKDKLIGVTEPRRVAAISMSQRVAEELNLTSKEISYLIRFEGNASSETKIKFMTDGVLMREIQKDFLLSKYSALIIDEAHERSVFTDILIGLLSRITLLRKKRNIPLKLIIMSATLRLSDFTENTKLFKVTPPVIKVDSRQFPVTVHFNKKTAIDYMSESYKKACKIHSQLPEGGILIFVTGQQEVNALVKKLRSTFPLSNKVHETNEEKSQTSSEVVDSGDEGDAAYCSDDEDTKKNEKKVVPLVNIEDYEIKSADEELEFDESDDDIEDVDIDYKREFHQPMWVLPIYSMLPSRKQARIFLTPPKGCRLCVVATNVAETSITIPNVKYVIDCGRTKTRIYDKLTGVSTFAVTWTSKASADQRAGRAGRTSAGHCYRLYSSAVFNDEFKSWDEPEIRRKPVDDLMLMMKALRIDRVVNFPFPSTPDIVQLKSAERRLTLLGALQRNKDVKDEWASVLTPLGKSMAAFPVAPCFAKMLCLSRERDLLSYTIAIVATLSVQQFLLQPNDDFRKVWRSWAGVGHTLLLGDVMVLLRALGAAEHASMTKEGLEKFCELSGLRHKAIVEARKLRVQLTNEANLNTPNLNLTVDPKMMPPIENQARELRKIILSGMMDHVAYKLSNEELKQAGLSVHKAAYRTADMEDIIFLHSSSVLHKLKPTWIVYQEIYEHNEKMYARGITAIEPEWLPVYAASLCNISEPLKDPAPYYDVLSGRIMCYVSSTFGRSGWQLPIIELEHPVNEDKFKWFAVFLLDGSIFPKLKEFKEHLLSPPNTVFKTWAKFLVHRTNNLLKVLMEHSIDLKEKLVKQWEKDPEFLLNTYLEWLPESAHKEIKSFWPPL